MTRRVFLGALVLSLLMVSLVSGTILSHYGEIRGTVKVQNWLSPAGYNDPDNNWTNEGYAYDKDTSTGASCTPDKKTWGRYLELTLSTAITSNKIRYFVGNPTGNKISSIDVDVYRDGSWVDIYEGSFTKNTWTEKTFSEGSVSKARVRFYQDPGGTAAAYLNEFQFWCIPQ